MIVLKLLPSPELAAQMRQALEVWVDQLETAPPAPGYLPDEPELAEAWAGSLAEQLEEDLAQVHRFLDSAYWEQKPYRCSEAAALGFLRATAALRMAIRQRSLGPLSDAQLEQHSFDTSQLHEEASQALMLYAFLAALQDALVEELD